MISSPPPAAIFSIGVLLAGCAAPSSSGPRVEYACGSTRFSVDFAADTAVVTTSDAVLRLPIAISASGARYTDGTSTYWEHQGTALLELPDTSYSNCLPV